MTTVRRLKRLLDALYRRSSRAASAKADPIEFPRRYARPADAEVVAIVAAAFSYGRVDLFKPVIARILAALDPSPHAALRGLEVQAIRRRLKGVAYRFNRTDDIVAFLVLLSQVIGRQGTLGAAFFACGGAGARERLAAFRREILSGSTAAVYGVDARPRGLTQLLPDPEAGSAAKRMFMFLRWMVRKDAIDLGLWAAFGAENLVIPLDTHVARIARNLGLTRRRTADYRTAVEVTEALRRLDPRDPVKYDFALAHLGISGACPARPSVARCAACGLSGLCAPGSRAAVSRTAGATPRGPRS